MKPYREMHVNRNQFLKMALSWLAGIGLLGKASATFGEAKDKQSSAAPALRQLGRTGIKVTAVGYGATRTMEPLLIKRAISEGINFIDTGRSYYRGQHEKMVGDAVKDVRKNVIIQSKMPIRLKEAGDALHTKQVREKIGTWMDTMLNQSLKALQTDYIDIMLLHGTDRTEINNHETIQRFLQDAKKAGKIRAFGFSSHKNHVSLVKDNNRSGFFDVVMVPYNHKGAYTHSRAGYYSEWDQKALELELSEAEKKGIGVVAMKTCSGGPYAPEPKGKATYTAALRWILGHSYISTMAVAMVSHKEIDEDIKAMV